MFAKLDSWLIERVAQPAADKLARWNTADGIGRSLCIGSAVFTGGQCYLRYLENDLPVALALSAGVLMALIVVLLKMTPPPSEGMLPVARATTFAFRLSQVILLACLLIPNLLLQALAGDEPVKARQVLGVLETVLLGTGLYFMACRNNPPARQTRTAWADATGGA